MAIDPYWLEPFIKTPFLKGALFENKAPLRRGLISDKWPDQLKITWRNIILNEN